ncbi:MAG: hypothetical protein ABSC11_08690, partial [Smithella sp.]
ESLVQNSSSLNILILVLDMQLDYGKLTDVQASSLPPRYLLTGGATEKERNKNRLYLTGN